MLVLSRKAGETLLIGDNIKVTINRISGNRVTVGVEAPGQVKIIRGELEHSADTKAPMPVANANPSGGALAVDFQKAPLMAHRHTH